MPKKSSPQKPPTFAQQVLAALETFAEKPPVLTVAGGDLHEAQIRESVKLYAVNTLQEVKAALFAAAKGDREAIREVQAHVPIAPGRGRYRERTEADRREQGKVRKQKFDASARRFKAAVKKEVEKLQMTILRRINALPLKTLRNRPLYLAKREAIRDRALTAAERSANPATREAALQAKALQIQGHFP